MSAKETIFEQASVMQATCVPLGYALFLARVGFATSTNILGG